MHAGPPLAAIEAMHMEDVLTAKRDWLIEKQTDTYGDTLEPDQPVIEFQVQTQ